MSRVYCRIRFHAGRWRQRGRWGNRVRDAVEEAVSADADFVLTPPNAAGVAVTVEAAVDCQRRDLNALVECLHQRLVTRLRPESERQIEVEIVNARRSYEPADGRS